LYQTQKLNIAAAITFGIAAVFFAGTFYWGNLSFFLKLNHGLGNVGDIFLSLFTHLGETVPWVAALIFVLVSNRKLLLLLVCCFVVSTILVQGIKNALPTQPRPSKAFHNVVAIHTVKGVELHEYFSFPSGHTATAFTIFLLACYVIKGKWVLPIGLFYAILVGYSRIYLAQHFPKDVGGGILIAIATIYLSIYITQRINKNKMRSTLK